MSKYNIQTLVELRKELNSIDLKKVQFGVRPSCHDLKKLNSYHFELDTPLLERREIDGRLKRSAFCTDSDGTNPHIKITKPSGMGGRSGGYMFVGGAIGKRKMFIDHTFFTSTEICCFTNTDSYKGQCSYVDVKKQKIKFVKYTNESPYLECWLREHLDPNIPDNWDELHTNKTFEFCIITTQLQKTYDFKQVIAKTEREAYDLLKQQDPEIDVANRTEGYSGMREAKLLAPDTYRGFSRDDFQPIPQSYREWADIHSEDF